MADHRDIVGRADEQEFVDTLLTAVHDGLSQAIVIRGDPGVGKTTLLEHLARSATGAQVAAVAGVEPEAGLGFAAIHRLLTPYLDGVAALPGPQRSALEVAFGVRDGPPVTTFLVGLGVLTLLADAAREKPVLVVVDDAQWVDPESLQVLGFVARRVHAEGLGLIFSVTEPAELAALDGISELWLPGLGPDAATDLLVTLAAGRVDRPIAAQLAAGADGNPLVLTEVGRELASGRAAPGLLLDAPGPIGERLTSHFRDRVESLPAQTRELLLLAATRIGGDPNVVWRAAELAGLRTDAALPAEAAGLVTVSPELRFPHSLIRAAVYGTAAPAARRRAHELLARAIDPLTAPDIRAWHRAGACLGPDAEVAAELERCADRVGHTGGRLAEAEYLARAADLSPDAALAAARTLGAAAAALAGGAPLRAEGLLDAGETLFDGPGLHARARRLREQIKYHTGQPLGETPAALLAVATALVPVDRNLARTTALEAVELSFVTGHFIIGVGGAELGRAVLALALHEDPGTGEAGSDVESLLLAGLAKLAGVGYPEAAPALRRAVAALAEPETLARGVPTWFLAAAFAAHALWDDRARRSWLQRCANTARAAGALNVLQLTLSCLSIVDAETGHLDSAQALGEESADMARAVGRSDAETAGMSNPELLAWRGDEQATQYAAATAAAAAQYLQAADLQRPSLSALAQLHLARGHYPDAFEVAARLRDDESVRFGNEALPTLVEAGLRCGEHDTAAAALSELELRATASGTHWALGLLARSRALVDADPEPLYQLAVDHLEQTTVICDLARAQLLYGEWLRRQRRRQDARVLLRRAFQGFTDMGATAFADRARIELAATGERVRKQAPASPAILTPQERQIARLAADGASTQMIATQLFISSHTVAYHLGKAFRKLGVSSRQQLHTVLD